MFWEWQAWIYTEIFLAGQEALLVQEYCFPSCLYNCTDVVCQTLCLQSNLMTILYVNVCPYPLTLVQCFASSFFHISFALSFVLIFHFPILLFLFFSSSLAFSFQLRGQVGLCSYRVTQSTQPLSQREPSKRTWATLTVMAASSMTHIIMHMHAHQSPMSYIIFKIVPLNKKVHFPNCHINIFIHNSRDIFQIFVKNASVNPSETHNQTLTTPSLSSGGLKYKAFRDAGERREKKKEASFKNGKMSVVPINNLGFSVRQLRGVLWIPPMGPSLLPAVEL